MAMIECPACKAAISSLLSKCPKCGELQKRAKAPPSARKVESDAVKWAKMWAHVGAWSVIAGFLIPIPIPQIGYGQLAWGAFWTWDFFKTETLLPVGLFMPPLAGAAVLVLVFLSRDELLPRFMTFIGGFTIAVELALGLYMTFHLVLGEVNCDEIRPAVLGPCLTVAFAVVGAFAIAAGNRVRKTHPAHPWPRRLSGIGGILLFLFFVIPLGRRPPIVMFFSGDAWSHAWPVMFGCLGLLVYGVAGIASFWKSKDSRKTCRTMSILGRVALTLVPGSFLILNVISFDSVKGWAPVTLVVFKAYLTMYGAMVIFAAGLAALLTLKLKSAPAVPVPEPVSTG